MKVYELKSDVENYRWITMVREEDFDVQSEFNGTPISATWKPYAVEPILDDLNAGRSLSDFPTLGTIPTFSQRAADALLDLLVENGELLRLTSDAGQFYAYNVTRVVDALDQERSEVKRFQSSGRIMRVVRYEFLPDRIRNLAVFKVPQLPTEFVTDSFVRRVQEAKLDGFDFREVWSDTGAGV
jgi:hypothetical protein